MVSRETKNSTPRCLCAVACAPMPGLGRSEPILGFPSLLDLICFLISLPPPSSSLSFHPSLLYCHRPLSRRLFSAVQRALRLEFVVDQGAAFNDLLQAKAQVSVLRPYSPFSFFLSFGWHSLTRRGVFGAFSLHHTTSPSPPPPPPPPPCRTVTSLQFRAAFLCARTQAWDVKPLFEARAGTSCCTADTVPAPVRPLLHCFLSVELTFRASARSRWPPAWPSPWPPARPRAFLWPPWPRPSGAPLAAPTSPADR